MSLGFSKIRPPYFQLAQAGPCFYPLRGLSGGEWAPLPELELYSQNE